MLFINLNSTETVEKLVKTCEKYKENYDMDTDILYGRYTLNGCSLLSIMSLMGKIVKIIPITWNDSVSDMFTKDITKMGGFIGYEAD